MSGRKVNGPMGGGRKRAPTDWGNAWRCRGLLLLTVGRTYALHRFGLWPRPPFPRGFLSQPRVITGGRKEPGKGRERRRRRCGAASPPRRWRLKTRGRSRWGLPGLIPSLEDGREKKDPPGHKPGGNLKRRCRVISLERDKPRCLYRAPLLIAAPWGYTPAGAPRFCRRDG